MIDRRARSFDLHQGVPGTFMPWGTLALETSMSGKVLISASELSDLMKAEPVVLMDTRDPTIYAEAHIPGAVDIREVFTYLATSTPEGMAALRDTFAAVFGKAGLSGAETAVIYEQSMSTGFGQSCRGYVLLRYLGYPKVRILHGGYAAWVAAGHACCKDLPYRRQGHAHSGGPGNNENGRQRSPNREAGRPRRG
jgi:3-mercaptopyruvate sulfurtransferase SseA